MTKRTYTKLSTQHLTEDIRQNDIYIENTEKKNKILYTTKFARNQKQRCRIILSEEIGNIYKKIY